MQTEVLHTLAGCDHELSEHDHSHVERSKWRCFARGFSTAALPSLFRRHSQIRLAGNRPIQSFFMQLCTCILPDIAQISETAAGSSPRQTTQITLL